MRGREAAGGGGAGVAAGPEEGPCTQGVVRLAGVVEGGPALVVSRVGAAPRAREDLREALDGAALRRSVGRGDALDVGDVEVGAVGEEVAEDAELAPNARSKDGGGAPLRT